jgi:glycosyltransferase involved in cell wall biosynthesis
MNPKVSFIVPCYKIAHFLPDCLYSILAQTYGDFEVLIMDDCSPDNTSEVAAKFIDPRVKYIRNETNLGHIRNYNKGIEISNGCYIWLISADDCLRSNDVLQKYVELLDKNPQVGYVFCPAITLMEGKEVGLEVWTAWPGGRDRVLSGREVVRRSAYKCAVCSPAGLVRKECYTRVGGGFPIDLPRTGDMYLWAVFAMMYDVGYFVEPMVYYRRHNNSMDKILELEQPSSFFEQDLLARWSIKKEANKMSIQGLISDFCRGLAEIYVARLVYKEVGDWQRGPTWDDTIKEIRDNASNEREAEEILRVVYRTWPVKLAEGYTRVGAGYYKMEQLDKAATAFRSALSANPWSVYPRIYLWTVRLEQLFGIRLLPGLKSIKGIAFSFLQRLIQRSTIFSHYYVDK